MRHLALALTLAIALAGCGSLPARLDAPTSSALRPSPDSPLVRIAQDPVPAPDLSGFRLMPLGLYSLDARIQLTRRARYSLDLQYYQISDDRTGRLLLGSLRDAALRGVRVRVLVDDLETAGADRLFVGLAAFPNVEVRLFNPFCCARETIVGRFAASLPEISRLNHRMHNKLFLADGAMAIAGGRNIGDEYFMLGASENYVDMDALIVGAVVPQLEAIFDSYWNSPHAYPAGTIITTTLDHAQLRDTFDGLVAADIEAVPYALAKSDMLGYGPVGADLDAGDLRLVWAKATAFADPPAKVTATSNESARALSVSLDVMSMVMRSAHSVTLVSPYFIPGTAGVKALGDLRQRNVEVIAVTNSLASTDERIAYAGFSRFRTDLLRSGVDLYELNPVRIVNSRHYLLPGRLHAKLVVFDHAAVFIGSMNLDPRSASKNTELGIIAESPQLAMQVRLVIEARLRDAYRLELGPDGHDVRWLLMGHEDEQALTTDPETSLLMRLQNTLLAPFVPEQEL